MSWDYLQNQQTWNSIRSKIKALVSRQPNYTSLEAEDLLHEAMTKLLERPDRIIKQPDAYLRSMVLNMMRDAQRVKQYRELGSDDEVWLSLQDPTPLQDEILEIRQQIEVLCSKYKQLSKYNRTILEMSRIDGLTHKEIAKCMNISVSAVEKHIAKALKILSSD
ncbi:RNA polymerase sigma factor [Acetobacter persici]|uniref:RNA polymerase sigma factor n=1 Tax=Acetobacter persici TaxID=1076596 RepID=UPI001BACB688|nr:sigma-70 family RNA polymerase sigma factor [Acetobacter persici]MBS0961821.1 sigma-70 family RNA polymerase sigma factor [Acetobacter persici]